jgi:hypothetical protein
LKRIGDLYAEKDNIGKPVMAIFFVVDYFILCYRGYWYAFGGFMMGAIMPDIAKFRMILLKK